MLSVLIFMPLTFIIVIACLKSQKTIKQTAVAFSFIYFLFSLLLFVFFKPHTAYLQLVEKHEWLSGLGVQYFVGVDGLSIWFVLLTAFLTPISVCASLDIIKEKAKGFYVCLFLMVTSVMGSFLSLDMVLFFYFFESSLVPLYFIIGIWGGKERIRACFKFFIYTMVGSLFLLAGIVSLMYLTKQATGSMSASVLDFYRLNVLFSDKDIFNQQNILFFCFFSAFAIKLPLVPFHTWLPLAHVEAPSIGSAWLAGVVLKMGAYSFFRFLYPLFPQSVEFFAPVIVWLAVCSIVYGAMLALSQTNIKKLIAYSSVSHMGYILLGLFSLNIYGLTGAFYQALAHAVSSVGLFLLAGILYERAQTLEIADYKGLAQKLPFFSVCFIIFCLSAIALPSTAGFMAEFLVILGAFKGGYYGALMGALFVVVLGAGVMLYLIHRVFFGNMPINTKLLKLHLREKCFILPLVVFVFIMGLFPNMFLKYSSKSLNHLVKNRMSYQLHTHPLSVGFLNFKTPVQKFKNFTQMRKNPPSIKRGVYE